MITFLCKTNHDYPYVNVAHFRLKSGEMVTVDRSETSWDYNPDTGSLYMAWHGCYIWDGEEERRIPSGALKDAELLELEIEDDAPDGYRLTVEEYSC